jgi:hypothetical protein
MPCEAAQAGDENGVLLDGHGRNWAKSGCGTSA